MWLHSLASDNKLVPRESFNSIDEAEVPQVPKLTLIYGDIVTSN